MKKLLCIALCVCALVLSISACGTDKAAIPHGNVSATDLTDSQAQEIMAVIVPRQFEIFALFNGDVDTDATKTCPLDKNYVLVTDERFNSVQEIKEYVLKTMTREAAQKEYFDRRLSDKPNPDDDGENRFIDYEGKLYFGEFSGSGFAYEMRPETTRIIERTENTVKVEMNTLYSGEDDGWLYTPTLVKTKDGWRVDCSIQANEGRYYK